jgi:hypothetical protein
MPKSLHEQPCHYQEGHCLALDHNEVPIAHILDEDNVMQKQHQ